MKPDHKAVVWTTVFRLRSLVHKSLRRTSVRLHLKRNITTTYMEIQFARSFEAGRIPRSRITPRLVSFRERTRYWVACRNMAILTTQRSQTEMQMAHAQRHRVFRALRSRLPILTLLTAKSRQLNHLSNARLVFPRNTHTMRTEIRHRRSATLVVLARLQLQPDSMTLMTSLLRSSNRPDGTHDTITTSVKTRQTETP